MQKLQNSIITVLKKNEPVKKAIDNINSSPNKDQGISLQTLTIETRDNTYNIFISSQKILTLVCQTKHYDQNPDSLDKISISLDPKNPLIIYEKLKIIGSSLSGTPLTKSILNSINTDSALEEGNKLLEKLTKDKLKSQDKL